PCRGPSRWRRRSAGRRAGWRGWPARPPGRPAGRPPEWSTSPGRGTGTGRRGRGTSRPRSAAARSTRARESWGLPPGPRRCSFLAPRHLDLLDRLLRARDHLRGQRDVAEAGADLLAVLQAPEEDLLEGLGLAGLLPGVAPAAQDPGVGHDGVGVGVLVRVGH